MCKFRHIACTQLTEAIVGTILAPSYKSASVEVQIQECCPFSHISLRYGVLLYRLVLHSWRLSKLRLLSQVFHIFYLGLGMGWYDLV